MGVLTDQIEATLGIYAVQLSETIVSCTHAYTDDGGAHSQTFDAIEGNVKANSVFRLEGKLDAEVKTLTVIASALDPYDIRPGEIVTTREGDETAKTRTILDVEVSRGFVVLTVARQYE